jgi:hypothetical protein
VVGTGEQTGPGPPCLPPGRSKGLGEEVGHGNRETGGPPWGAGAAITVAIE